MRGQTHTCGRERKGVNAVARVVSLVYAIGVVCLIAGMFLWQYGAQGMWLLPCAALGAAVAMVLSQALLSRVMMGVASITGGIVGSMASGSAVSPCVHSNIPAPYGVFVGAVLGAAMWIICLTVPVFNKRLRQAQKQEEDRQQGPARPEKPSDYVLVSLSSFVIGPILGLIFFLIYSVGVGIEPVDEWPVFGYLVRGATGALLCHIVVGTIGGLVFGVPYLMAWWIEAEQRDVTSDNNFPG